MAGENETISARSEFQRVLDTDTLTHPVTGEELTQASAHLVPFFELETDLFSRGAAL